MLCKMEKPWKKVLEIPFVLAQPWMKGHFQKMPDRIFHAEQKLTQPLIFQQLF